MVAKVVPWTCSTIISGRYCTIWFPPLGCTALFQLQNARRPAKFRRYRMQPRFEMLEDRCLLSATTYTVNSLLDTDTGSGNTGTLPHVINQANANNTGTAGAPDIIQFATGGGTIDVDSMDGGALAALTDVAVIDATTETGYNGTPLVTLDGTSAGVGANGLTISGGQVP